MSNAGHKQSKPVRKGKARGGVVPRDEDIEMCMTMGFSRENAIHALRARNGSVEQAIEYLLDNPELNNQPDEPSSDDSDSSGSESNWSSQSSSHDNSPRPRSASKAEQDQRKKEKLKEFQSGLKNHLAASSSSSSDNSSSSSELRFTYESLNQNARKSGKNSKMKSDNSEEHCEEELIANLVSHGFPVEVVQHQLRKFPHDSQKVFDALMRHAELLFEEAQLEELMSRREQIRAHLRNAKSSRSSSAATSSSSSSSVIVTPAVLTSDKSGKKNPNNLTSVSVSESESKESNLQMLEFGDYIHLVIPSPSSSKKQSKNSSSASSSSQILLASQPHAHLGPDSEVDNLALATFQILRPDGTVGDGKSIRIPKNPKSPANSNSNSSFLLDDASSAPSAVLRNGAQLLLKCASLDNIFLSIEGNGAVSCIREGPADFFMLWNVRIFDASTENKMLPVCSGDRLSLSSNLRMFLSLSEDGKEAVGLHEPMYWTIKRVENYAAASSSLPATPEVGGIQNGLVPPMLSLAPSSSTNSNNSNANSSKTAAFLTPPRVSSASFSSTTSATPATSHSPLMMKSPQLIPLSPIPPTPSVDSRVLQKSGTEWWEILRDSYRLAALRLQRLAISQVREKFARDQRHLERSRAENAQKRECVSCWEVPPNTVLLECGHICLCQTCAPTAKNCPLCRKDITRFVVQKR